MKIVDLNVLLYTVNENAVHHVSLLKWWEQAVNGADRLGLPWIVLLGFLRISTNPRIFPQPLDPGTAVQRIGIWLSLDNTRLIREKEEHWDIVRSLLAETGTAGNLTPDAHRAALAISHGAVLVSCDNDFARFKGLRRENPIG